MATPSTKDDIVAQGDLSATTTTTGEEEGEDPTSTPTTQQEQHLAARRNTTSSNTKRSNTTTNNKNKNNKRHGARNQHRHQQLCKWIMDHFPIATPLQKGDLVVDVAGGKGELAARLTMCHQLHVLMIDPRLADLPTTFERTVLPKLPKRHQTRFQQRTTEHPDFLKDVLNERFQQLDIVFDESTVESNSVLQEALRNCQLIIGMHADGATECIIDVALQFQKPFLVIPCCVFPNLFQQRTVMDIDEDTGVEKRVQVRSHDQFCRYLLAKDKRFRQVVLPFEGRNVAILWDGNE